MAKLDVICAQLRSLSQETRLRIFRELVCAGSAGLCAGDICKRLDVPCSAMSFTNITGTQSS